MAMFARVRELLEDGDAFVCILIDEVESLTAARKAAVAGRAWTHDGYCRQKRNDGWGILHGHTTCSHAWPRPRN